MYGINDHNKLAEAFARGRQEPAFRRTEKRLVDGKRVGPSEAAVQVRAKLGNYRESRVSSPPCEAEQVDSLT